MITIKCNCGQVIDTEVDTEIKFEQDVESYALKKITCPTCGAEYRFSIRIDSLAPGHVVEGS